MKKSPLRVAVAISLLPVVLLVAGYMTWSWWSITLLRNALSGYDIELRHATITRPGLDAISLGDLALDIHLPGYSVSVRSNLLSVNYRLLNLLRGRIDRIRADQLDLSMIPADNGPGQPESAAAPASLQALLPQQLLQDIPISKIQVGRLTLNSPLLQQYGPLQGNLRLDGAALVVQLNSRTQADTSLQLSIGRDNSLSSGLTLDGAPVLQLESLITDDAMLQGRLRLDLKTAHRLLAQLGLVQFGEIQAGELLLDWSGSVETLLQGRPLDNSSLSGQFSGTANGRLPAGDSEWAASISSCGSFTLGGSQALMVLQDATLTARGQPPADSGLLQSAIQNSPLSLELQIKPGARLGLNYGADSLPGGDLQLQQLSAHLQVDAGGNSGQHSVAIANLTLDNTALRMNPANIQAADPGHELQLQSHFTLTSLLDTMTAKNMTARGLHLTTAGEIKLASGQLRIDTLDATLLTAEQVDIGADTHITKARISLADALTATVDRQSLQVPVAHISARAAKLQMPDLELQLADAAFELGQLDLPLVRPEQSSVRGQLLLRDLVVHTGDKKTAAINLQAQLGLAQQQLQGRISASAGKALISAQADLQHYLATNSGRLTADLSSTSFTLNQAYLPRLLQPLPMPADLTAGNIEASVEATWNGGEISRSQARVTLNQVDGFYQRNLVHGLSGSLQVDNLFDRWHAYSDKLHIRSANTGFVIDDIQFALDVQPPTLKLRDFRAELFGGVARQSDIVYDWSLNHNSLSIDLVNIQLQQLMELEKGISGSGSLDGHLPLTISPSGISIVQGSLRNRAPGGVIRYESEVPTGNSAVDEGLRFTLNSLKNFHYTLLSAEVDSDVEGNLTLAAKIHGRNPDLKQQQPVHFNLNINENLPALIKSLKLSQDISDDLSRRIEALPKPGPQETRQ